MLHREPIDAILFGRIFRDVTVAAVADRIDAFCLDAVVTPLPRRDRVGLSDPAHGRRWFEPQDQRRPMTSAPGTTIVSGGSSGIGKAVVEGLLQRGRPVAILDIKRPPDELLAGDQVLFVECDVADPVGVHEAVAEIASRVTRVDGLSACAGMGGASGRQAIGSLQWDRVKALINVNLLGPYWLLEACADAMTDGGGGSIVLVGSVLSRRGIAGFAAYSAAKGGVESLTRSASVELADRGIRVNCVLPGPILTPMSRSGFEADGLSVEQGTKRLAAGVPLNRVGQPQEVAAVVLFLLDSASSYMTGASVLVDGGAIAG